MRPSRRSEVLALIHDGDTAFDAGYALEMHALDLASDAVEAHLQIEDTVALESAGEDRVGRLRTYYEKLKALLLRLWEAFKRLVNAIVGDIARAKIQLDYAKMKTKEVMGRNPKASRVNIGPLAFGIAAEAGAGSDQFKVPKDGQTLLRFVRENLKQLTMIQDHYLPTVHRIGVQLQQNLGSVPTGGLDSWLNNLNLIARQYDLHRFMQQMSKIEPYADPRFPTGTAFRGPPLPGGRSLVFVDGSKMAASDARTLIRDAEQLQASKIQLTRTAANRQLKASQMVMDTMPPIMMDAALKVAEELISKVDALMNNVQFNALSGIGEQLTRMTNVPSNLSEADVALHRAGNAYAHTFVQWCRDPMRVLLSKSLETANTTVRVCNRNIQAYQ